MSTADYLRTTVYLGDSDRVDETLTSDSWYTFKDAGIPLSFEVPVEWKTFVSKTGTGNYVDLKNIRLWHYADAEQDVNSIITQILGASIRDLISYPAKIGATSGTMWARANVVGDTKAPIGDRVYIPEVKQGLSVMLLPAPPYTDIQLRIINSLTAR